ncbi:protein spire [Eurytemora carolleeae]|uniref:protein spire n=1 Tax=Eurytemora carolleeae TaxID=1294199 RepID=UPI000C76FF12|nr:protein spire [Eurytemora carolleeae]|eukprot:XP_023335604.1 protein spire-like [Eurytemora affinis]
MRSKRYKLNHVEIPERLKKDAREVILDFIRSRPPLRPASARQLKPLRKESTPGELLMQDIRSCKARQSLRRTNMPKPIRSQFEEKSRTRLDGKLDNLSPGDKVNKKVIDLDESMLKNMLDFETEENSSNTSQEAVFLDESVVTPDTTPVSTSRKKSTGRRNSLNKSTDRRGSLVKSNWRKSVSVMESPTSQSTDLSTPILSPLTRKKDDIHEYLSSTVLGSKDWDFVKNLHSLDLTIEELAHIRAQLTKAELEEKNMGEEKKRDLEKGRLCFVCEVVKFGVFNWASYCIICNKYICSKCVTKIKLPSDNLREIPVSILTNQLCSNQHPDVEAEYSVIRRLSVQIGLPTKPIRSGLSPTTTPSRPNPTTQHRPRLFRQQTSPDLKGSQPASTASRSGLERSGWNRNSLRNPPQVPSSIQQTAPSRPKLVRSKTMTKNDVEKLQTLKLSQPGSLHSTCTTCRDILTCLVRAKMETDKLHKIKGRLTTFQEENITPY